MLPATIRLALLDAACSFDTKFIEFQGTVMNPNTIKEDEHEEFGNEFGALSAATVVIKRGGCSISRLNVCTQRADHRSKSAFAAFRQGAPCADALGKP